MEKIIKIITFALLLTSCQEQECPRKCNESCFQMTLSNALPVQFWLNGEESFNDKVIDGVERVCFMLPFQCDDEISLQFTNDDDLLIFPALSSWVTGDLDPEDKNWTTGSNPSVAVKGAVVFPEPSFQDVNSEILSVDYSFVSGETYAIIIKYTLTKTSGALPRLYLRIYDDSFNQQFTSGGGFISTSGEKEISITFTATSDCTKIGLYAQGGVTGTTSTFTINEGFISNASYDIVAISDENEELGRSAFTESIVGDRYVYDVSFSPNDFGICDRKIKLQIIDNNASPGILAESDYLSIHEAHPCTKLISYSNNSDFAGLAYTDLSPIPVFSLRIPAIFFEEELPTEQQDTELSNGEIVRLYNKLELKRRLDTGFMPQYMHQKLQLVLMHDNIEIDEKQWIRRDAYEKKEGNRSYPLRRASVFLHDKDFIKENQL